MFRWTVKSLMFKLRRMKPIRLNVNNNKLFNWHSDKNIWFMSEWGFPLKQKLLLAAEKSPEFWGQPEVPSDRLQTAEDPWSTSSVGRNTHQPLRSSDSSWSCSWTPRHNDALAFRFYFTQLVYQPAGKNYS